jgi:putative protease
MIRQRPIELLAPARNVECGMAAVDHGADAVYIGAAKYGARAAAGNSVEDIARLVAYAHTYHVKVYVTINTILKDEELSDTEKMVWELYRCGVDALIVQDMAMLRLHLPPIPLHASTQMDNRSADKVKFLQQNGFSQVVLARELSLQEIKDIHEQCDIPLEVFVHGALCVSYSGQCYVSQHCFGRSANRGECAQFCRLKFDLQDSDGRVVERGKHLLSLKDMNRSEDLERLLDAGVSSLKIEGRLKDVAYVKNVTAYYRKRLDDIFVKRNEYRKASSGHVTLKFIPQLEKSFNRGFTRYFLDGRTADIFSFNTPKSLGEEVGIAKEIRGNYIVVSGVKSFANGDGLCFIDEKGVLQGFRVNRVDANKIYPMEMPHIRPKTRLFRNYDKTFEDELARPSAVRKISVSWLLTEYTEGFVLQLRDEDDVMVSVSFPFQKELARNSQAENIKVQLSKLGNTPFEVFDTVVELQENWFIPSSVLSEWRRVMVERLLKARKINYHYSLRALPTPFTDWLDEQHGKKKMVFAPETLTYLANVMNEKAAQFYRMNGVKHVLPAFEQQEPEDAVLMFCKHCLRYSLGWCPRNGQEKTPYREPFFLVSSDGRRFRLSFDCKNCQMKVCKS